MLRTTRARWVVRTSIALLFLGIVSYFTLAALHRTTSIPASEAKKQMGRIRLGTPLTEIERIYGPAQGEEQSNGRWLTWAFQEESLNHYQMFSLTVKIHDGEVINLQYGESILKGWDLWKSRWNSLYWRFRN
jgi:hypothetical protein